MISIEIQHTSKHVFLLKALEIQNKRIKKIEITQTFEQMNVKKGIITDKNDVDLFFPQKNKLNDFTR